MDLFPFIFPNSIYKFVTPFTMMFSILHKAGFSPHIVTFHYSIRTIIISAACYISSHREYTVNIRRVLKIAGYKVFNSIWYIHNLIFEKDWINLIIV